MIPDQDFSELQLLINTELPLSMGEAVTQTNWLTRLGERINEMIIHDFNGLVTILYRFDVDEKRIRNNLRVGDHDSGRLIAQMIVDRLLEKIKTRRQYRRDDLIDENEKW